MMYGWTGTILRVNLTKGTISKEPLNEKYAYEYIGQRGLAVKYHYEECAHDIDPLGPENNFLLMTGPLTGLFGTCTGRYEAVAKSPLTLTMGGANSGGHFGPELKFAGYDGIIFEGQSPEPVYLYIYNDKVELRSAAEIWGKTVYEATDYMKAHCSPKARVTCIGPTSENLCLLGNVINDKHRALGRGGLGAVMGSKKLKGVVVRGTKSLKVAHPQEYLETVLKDREDVIGHPVPIALGGGGTVCMINVLNSVGSFPLHNFRDGAYDPDVEPISGEVMHEKYVKKNKACFGCPIGCGRVTEIKEGPYAGIGEGPEYEAAWAFGSDTGVHDLDAVIYCNWLCNEYGMDPISLGSTIACAIELATIGALTEDEIGLGRPLRFNDTEAVVELTKMVCENRGFGKRLAQGSYRLAESCGHPEYSMSCKKQEMPAYDGRSLQGMGLQFATSNRGGCHVRGYAVNSEVSGAYPYKSDPLETKGKPELVKFFQDGTAVTDSVGICMFSGAVMQVPRMMIQLTLATGHTFTEEDGKKIGERIWNLEKLYNIDAGVAEDTLPSRLLNEPLPEGAGKGYVVELKTMLPEYYKVRDWDTNGVPTPEKRAELNI